MYHLSIPGKGIREIKQGNISLKRKNRGIQQLIHHHLQEVQTGLEKAFSTIHLYYNTYFLYTSEEGTNPGKSDQYVTYQNHTYI